MGVCASACGKTAVQGEGHLNGEAKDAVSSPKGAAVSPTDVVLCGVDQTKEPRGAAVVPVTTPASQLLHELTPDDTGLPDPAAAASSKVVPIPPKPANMSVSDHLYTVCKNLQPGDKGLAESMLLRNVTSLEGAHGQPHDILSHGPPRPPNDEDRKSTLRTLGLEHAGYHPELSMLCQVVCSVFGTKVAALAMFSESRVWLAGAVGAPLGHAQWRISGCPWDLLVPTPTTMVCEDLTEDARFVHQPWTQAGLRLYVSSPLVASNGHRIGSICYMNDEKMRVDYGQCRLLNNIAEITVREVERYAQLKDKVEGSPEAAEVFTASNQEFLRNMMSAHSSCLVLLDTSVPGWKILYTNVSWREWTGVPRDQVLGTTLADALENSLDSSPLRCADHSDDLRFGRRFILPRLRLRGGAAAVAEGRASVFDLSFRSASLEALDNDTLPIDIPTFVPMDSDKEHIYVARMHAVNTSLMSGGVTTTPFSPRQVSPAVAAPLLIYGLRLHHVIGRGGYGTVYCATWQDNKVATKVQDYSLANAQEKEEAELEINLGQKLRHALVIHTLCHASLQMERRPQAPGAGKYFIDDIDDYTPEWCSGDNFSMIDSINSNNSDFHKSTAVITKPAHDSSVLSPGTPATHNGYLPTSSTATSRSGGVEGGGGALFDSGPQQHCSNGSSMGGMKHSTLEGGQDVWPQEMRTFQVLEFCDKGCLQDAIDRGWLRTAPSQLAGPNAAAVLATTLEIATGLVFLHGHGVVHGDLTASNILLKAYGHSERIKEQVIGGSLYHWIRDAYDREFRAKIADFGKSRILGVQEYIRTSSYGTITHMSPEVLRSCSLGRPADVYALGVLLWSMWTGSRPWAGLSHTQILATVITNAQALHFPEGTPPDVDTLGRQCMAFEPADRPDIGQVVLRLVEMMETRGVAVPDLTHATPPGQGGAAQGISSGA